MDWPWHWLLWPAWRMLGSRWHEVLGWRGRRTHLSEGWEAEGKAWHKLNNKVGLLTMKQRGGEFMQNKAREVTRTRYWKPSRGDAIRGLRKVLCWRGMWCETLWKIALTVTYIFSECWKAAGVTLSTTVLLKDTDVVKANPHAEFI